MNRPAVWPVLIGLVCVLVAACGSAGVPEADQGPTLRIVATTSILGDIATNIVGDQGTVEVLMEAGVDPHAFEPSASDADRLRRADLVIANGLQLETALVDALASVEEQGVPVLRVAEHLDPIPFAGEHAPGHGDESEGHASEAEDEDHAHGDESEGHASEAEEQDHGHGELDPHFWWDPVRTADGVSLIGDRVAEVAPEVAETVTSNAESYREEVLQLHERIDAILAAVPEPQRKLVTNHDSLGYLAARYGFEVVGTVLPGGTTLAEASGRDLAELVETIREAEVRAIFVETTAPSRLAEALNEELGGGIEIVELYEGSLGEPGSGADTYLGMMETNARRIADGLTA